VLKLKAAGITAIDRAARPTASPCTRPDLPMAWDMKGGELWVESVEGQSSFAHRVCRFADVPMWFRPIRRAASGAVS
jgi:hypothetical protein